MAVSRTAYDLSVLDTRQYRSDQACGFGAAKDCAAASRTDRSMLGAEQEAWLFARLPQVRATWTILGQQVPLFARDSGPQATGPRFSMDKWDGYTAGRQRLFTRLLETRSPNPIVLSGDVHVHYGADLRVDFADEKSPAIGTEFTNTAVTSGGDGTDVRQLRDSAALQPAHQVPQQSAGLYRLHRDESRDACRLHGRRRRDEAGCTRQARRGARRRDGTKRGDDGLRPQRAGRADYAFDNRLNSSAQPSTTTICRELAES
jgi:phosphodiesterase/alkaline phosphatase D-like protein